MKEHAFLLEIQKLAIEMDILIEKYDLRDKVVSVMVTGLLDEEGLEGQKLKAIYSYSLESRSELDSILDFIDNTWSEADENPPPPEDGGYKDIDDLLDGLGIDLE